MQDNWWILILLALAVLIYALAREFGQKDEDGETNGAASEQDESGEPGEMDMPWAECQRQLKDAPPIEACDRMDRMEFSPPDEVEAQTEAEPETETEVEPVPESGHAINTAIRLKAGRLLRENYRRILPLSAAFAALAALRLLWQSRLLLPEWAAGCLGPADFLNVLIAPMVALGAAYAAVRLWQGDAPRMGMLIRFLRERRFFPALGLTLVKLVLLALPMIAMAGGAALLSMFVAQAAPEEISRAVELANRLIYILMILVLAATAWLTAWLEMAGFAFVRAPERGAIAAVKAGFRTGNRRFGRVIGMLAAVGWPFAAVQIVQFIVAGWSVWLKSPIIQLAAEMLDLLLILFYGGYFLLSLAGLAENLTPGDGEAPRAEAEPPGGGKPSEAGILKAQAATEEWTG